MKRKLANKTIDPDDIFVDSKNIPDFDKHQFEGRLEKPIKKSTFVGIGLCFLILSIVLGGKIFQLQIIKGESFFSRSKNNYLRMEVVPAVRGIIYDRNGRELAWNDSVQNENFKSERSYLDMAGLAHVLGYVKAAQGGKITGLDGIEKKYDDFLSGDFGVKLIETNSKNETISESVSQPPGKGKSIRLTIASELQSELYKILGGVIRDRGFGGGGGVILDINSGEILAMTSYPEYNSQILSRGKPGDAINKYLNDTQKPFLNRVISGLYAPGSIIKPLIALAALNEKIITPDKKILSTGSISIPNPFFPGRQSVFKDWKAHGWVDMIRALAVSSNVYFYTIGGGYGDFQGLGINKIDKYAGLFGFGSKTNVDLNKEEGGLIPSPGTKAGSKDPIWRIGDTYHAAIGQGDFEITPLQAAVYAATIASAGQVPQPHLFLDDSKASEFSMAKKTIPIPKEYFQIVQEGMRRVVLEGTAQALSGLNVEIAAKSGTAELESDSNKFVNSWLIGFLPYENPKIAFSILLERGRPTNLIGGVFAGRQLFDWMIIHTPQYLTPYSSLSSI